MTTHWLSSAKLRMMRILDLYCGAGGAAKGYHDYGFEVVGVDLHEQPRFPYEFVQDDALNALDTLILGGKVGGYFLDDFDAIHASPPCQAWSVMSNCRPGLAETYPRLIVPTRCLLQQTGKLYVIENVPRAPLVNPVVLCGTSFGLRVRRHRLFETNFRVYEPPCDHFGRVLNPHNSEARKRMREEFGYGESLERIWKREVGVEWMNDAEARESIPPVYTSYIAGHVRGALFASLSGPYDLAA
jgi:DNA (cytosine-5)-methyltransferase 1